MSGARLGRPWCLPLAERVLLVAVYYRTNLTMRQLAPLFGVSPATVCRVVQKLGPLLALEPVPRRAESVERLWIVDGTLIPVRDRTVGASSRNYRFSANVQVIIDADTRLVVATARPAPGNRADAHVWRASGMPEQCQGAVVLGDGAHINTGLVVPHRKRPGRALLPEEEADNAEHRRVRARVEHTFARIKNYKILRDCRQKGPGLHHAVQAVATKTGNWRPRIASSGRPWPLLSANAAPSTSTPSGATGQTAKPRQPSARADNRTCRGLGEVFYRAPCRPCRNTLHMNSHASGQQKIIKVRTSRTPGRVVRIDLGDGQCAYGRQLTGMTLEFYDQIGEPDEPADLIGVIAAPVAFRIWVMNSAFRRRGGWELLDVVSLTQEEQAEVHSYDKQDPLSGAISIYRVDPVTGDGSETPATLEECQGLERAAVWSPEHVEDRLRDHFDGRPNRWVESMRLKR